MMHARLAVVAVLASLALVACGRPAATPTVRFETSGAPLTSTAAEALAASTDIGAFASVTSTDAPALRTKVLGQLRVKGDAGVRAADLLTKGFPASTPSVPVLVRLCAVDGIDAVVVVEAFGDAGGKLTHRRLWIFDRTTGALLRAASFS